jgi:hypothetical protein
MPDFLPIPPTSAIEDKQVRAVLDALSQNIQVSIEKFAAAGTTPVNSNLSASKGGLNTFGGPNSVVTNNTNVVAAYTRQNLITDLTTGAVSIISGGTSSSNIMKVGSNYVVFQNSLANPLGSVSPYSGVVRTALGLFSTGIVGGYNDPTTGAWISSITIDTSTGNLNVLGTIKANSIIQVGAYLGTQTVSSVLSDVSTANSNATAALAAVAAKLNKSAADILSGPIDFTTYGGFKTSGMTIAIDGTATGQGVAFTSKGIVGRNSTTTTFTINSTTGDASFGGTLTAATGTFIGTVSAGNFVTSGGTIGTQYGTNAWIAGTSGPGYNAGDSWFGGTMTIGGKLIVNGAFTTGGVNVGQYIATPATDMALYAQNTGSGSAAAFYNTTTGTFGSPTLLVQQGGTGPVLKAINPYAGGIGSLFSTNKNYAFVAARLNDAAPVAWFQGPIALSLSDSIGTAWQLSNPSSTINAAGGGYYLAGDGAWHSVGSITSGVSSFNTRTGAVTLSSSDVTSALTYTPYNGATNPNGYLSSITSSQITTALTYTPYNGSTNPNGYITNSTSSLSNYSTTTTTQTYIQSYAAHQFNADVGTAYVSSGNINIYVSITGFQSSGSGNTITIQNVSDRNLKRDIVNETLGLDFVKKLTPVTYSMIKGNGRKLHGFIAQDVEPLIDGDNDALKITNEDGSKGVDYLSLIAPMAKAIQELSAKVDALEAKLAETRT